mmetsp:Transcript_22333/g.72452  ORF Transcript_22333/g.72452 Transcript_22333/m.72452 type:complete len:241 (+) Transcript_22333:472-1194(+)
MLESFEALEEFVHLRSPEHLGKIDGSEPLLLRLDLERFEPVWRGEQNLERVAAPKLNGDVDGRERRFPVFVRELQRHVRPCIDEVSHARHRVVLGRHVERGSRALELLEGAPDRLELLHRAMVHIRAVCDEDPQALRRPAVAHVCAERERRFPVRGPLRVDVGTRIDEELGHGGVAAHDFVIAHERRGAGAGMGPVWIGTEAEKQSHRLGAAHLDGEVQSGIPRVRAGEERRVDHGVAER